MKTWKDKLTTSQATFMQEIVDQVPEAMGVRNVFVDVLNTLAGVTPLTPGVKSSKFRFAIVGSSDDVRGTNDEKRARELADDESNFVIDMAAGTWLVSADPSDDSTLTEAS